MRKELKAAAPGYLCGWRVSVCVFRLRLSRCASQNTCQRCETRQGFVLVVWRGLFGLDNGQQVLLVLIEYVEDCADGLFSGERGITGDGMEHRLSTPLGGFL